MSRYRYNRARGLCGKCGTAQPVPGRTNCAPCAEYMREYRRNKYAEDPTTDKARAERFHNENRDRRLQHWKKEYVRRCAEAICHTCRRPHRGKTVNCRRCLDALHANRKQAKEGA